MPGGFTGVDCFFVISGYLITRILLTEVSQSKFSILAFYQRRVLRIVPAFVTVAVASSIAATALLLPTELLKYAHSLTAAALSYSNVHFWHADDYFGGAAEHIPLLHTWSLAVEEQFYIILPPILLLIHRFAKTRLKQVLIALVAVSFVFSCLVVLRWPSAAFYLLPTRAWELGIGSYLASCAGSPTPSRQATWLSYLGGLLLLGPMFFLTGEHPFPGATALPTCLGTALLIRYSEGSPLRAFLSWRPFVAIGLISYSLYLWHWPVLVFMRLCYGDNLGPALTSIAIGISVFASAASYHWIEQPFRTKRFRSMRSASVVASGVVALAVIAVGGAVMGDKHRQISYVPPEFQQLASYMEYHETKEHQFQFRSGQCYLSSKDKLDQFDESVCLGSKPGHARFLVVGDSHAAHLWRAISEVFPEAFVGQANGSGHRPLIGLTGRSSAIGIYDRVFGRHIREGRYDAVFLAGRWQSKDLPALSRTIRYLRDHVAHVVVLGPIVEYEGDLPELLIRTGLRDQTVDAHLLTPGKRELDADMARIVVEAGGIYVSLMEIMCENEADGCMQQLPSGVPMQFDYGHLTLDGSRYVAAEIRKRVEARLLAGRPRGAGERS